MEQQIFDWGSFDVADDLVWMYFDCTLKINVPGFTQGTAISSIIMDYEDGKMIFLGPDDNEIAQFKLSFEVEKL